ncbi:hypothetical protein WJX72_005199 [[Myrmecia] bisecta]|uniref:Vacuolar protein-sorting-associated protein 36 n=1 Tax=[Myrmecia] bisecta TaxID=41462 RepID=A0AAW1Q683_9CHLO
MIVLDPVQTGADGRPQLHPGEVQLTTLGKVDLQFVEGEGGSGGLLRGEHEDGQVVLTSHRCIWLDCAASPRTGASCAFPLSAVHDVQLRASHVWSSPKVRFFVHLTQDQRPAAGRRGSVRIEELKLAGRNPDRFAELARRAVEQRAWENSTISAPLPQYPPAMALANQPYTAAQPDQQPQQYPPAHWPPAQYPPPVFGAGSTAAHAGTAAVAHTAFLDARPSGCGPGPLGAGPLAAGLGGLGAPVGPHTAVETEKMEQLCAMGFLRHRVLKALEITNNAGFEEVTNWLFLHEGDSSLDDPLPGGLPDDWTLIHAPQAAVPQLKASQAGVAGLLRREQQLASDTDRSLEQAFTDLRALMATAQDMVQLAERFRAALASAGSEGTPGPGQEEWMDREMEADLISMGLAAPVTKESAGAAYHQQLARQVADFLQRRLDRVGGMMPLPDVYCLFNRARGAELVSPDDLLAALQLLPHIGAPLRLHRFASGVLVVQSNSHNEDEVCSRIGELVQAGEGLGPALTASDVARALTIPVAIAAEHLLTAESRGVLCRDDGPEGLRFFANFFASVPMPVY